VRTIAAAMTTRWCLGVIALRWWQARRVPAGSKIVKRPVCAAEVDRSELMGVVPAKVVGVWLNADKQGSCRVMGRGVVYEDGTA
jgi:hypothetical protein